MTKQTELATKYKVFECVAGSHAYGTNLPTSDFDTRGVFIAPPQYIWGVHTKIKQVDDPDADDSSFLEFRQFVMLAKECNPNIIELLFTDKENILFMDWPFEQLRENAHLFLSKRAKHTFGGYAESQLKRIRGHKKWINRPQPKEPPLLSDYCTLIDHNGDIYKDGPMLREFLRNKFLVQTFGRTSYRVYIDPSGNFKPGCFNDADNDLRYVDIKEEKLTERSPLFQGILNVNFTEFTTACDEWKKYWEWKKNRNPHRAALEEAHSFDTKHAMHLVRLLCMAKEILAEGTVRVRRPNAAELLAIREGKWTYEQIIEWSEKTKAELEELYKTSTLRFGADDVAINKLYMDISLKWWSQHNLLSGQIHE